MKNQVSLFPILVTVFIDMLGIGIIIPILGHLFLDPNGILNGNFAFQQRTILLGLLVASYPIAQFLGAPILGALSDRHGRKNILLISLFGTFIGYIFFAYGILTRNLALLFISRFLDGFTGGNISIAMSAIADISDHEEKTKNFGLVGMTFGIGFILGPFIGGKLADPSVVSWFSASTPFFFAAAMTLFNMVLVMMRFRETLSVRRHTPISALTGFRNIFKAFGMTNLRTMFLVVFLLTLGFTFFTQFFQVFLIEKFNYTQSQIGDLFAYIGIWIAMTQGGLARMLSERFHPEQVLSVSLLVLSLALPFLLLPGKAAYLFFILPFISISNGLTMPNSTAVISNLAAQDSQGEIMGINQSIQALAMSIPPIVSGFLIAFNIALPILVAGATIFMSWLTFILFFRGRQKKLFHEV